MKLGIYGKPIGRMWDPGVLWDEGLVRAWVLEQEKADKGAFYLQTNTVGYWEGPDVEHLERINDAYCPEWFSNAWHVRRFGDQYVAYFSECEGHDGKTPDHHMRIGTSHDGFTWNITAPELGYRGYESKDGYKGELDPFIVEHQGRYWLFLRVTGITWGLEPQVLCGAADTPTGPWPSMKPVLGTSITEHFGETERFTVYPHKDKWRLVFSCWRKYVDAEIRGPTNYQQWIAESENLSGPYELVDRSMPLPYGYGTVITEKDGGWITACWRFSEEGAVADMFLAEHEKDPRP